MQSTRVAPAQTRKTVASWIAARNGVSHTSDLLFAGYSHREMARAVGDASVRRVRRCWLVTADADERRVRAAEAGGRPTCVSAAALLGIWVPEHSEVHVAVQATASRNRVEGVRLHWASGPAPVSRTMAEEPIVNVLFHAARCLSPRDALGVWESAIRTKRVDRSTLARVSWRSARAASLAATAKDLSDSELETRFVSGMRRHGVVVRQQVRIDGRSVDGLIGDSLVVQLDGFAFHSSAQDRRRDIEADARLRLRGFTVLRFDFYQVNFEWEYVVETILMAIAQQLHRHRIR